MLIFPSVTFWMPPLWTKTIRIFHQAHFFASDDSLWHCPDDLFYLGKSLSFKIFFLIFASTFIPIFGGKAIFKRTCREQLIQDCLLWYVVIWKGFVQYIKNILKSLGMNTVHTYRTVGVHPNFVQAQYGSRARTHSAQELLYSWHLWRSTVEIFSEKPTTNFFWAKGHGNIISLIVVFFVPWLQCNKL